MNRPNSKIHELRESGALPLSFDIPQDWKSLISCQQYQELYFMVETDLTCEGPLFNQVKSYLHDFLMAQPWSFEWMLAVRQGPEDEELEGIWHDDSSRSVAISLSLNSNPEDIQGGQLLMRRFEKLGNKEEILSIGPRPMGAGHIFATGQQGWEHKTCRVTSGNRLILVIWISLADEKKAPM